MADGGEQLLTATILGQLSQVARKPYPIRIISAEPIMDSAGNYETAIKVVMASGTYLVTITEQPELYVIQEEA